MIRNGFYNFAGSFIRQGLTFISIPILIHLIGIENYGLWTLVSSILGIAGLAESGLSLSSIVFLAQDLEEADHKEISKTLTVIVLGIFILATLWSSLLFIFADPITHLFKNLSVDQSLVVIHSLKIGGFLLWTRLVQQICTGIEQAYKQYRAIAIFTTAHTIMTNIGMIGVASQGFKVITLMQWCLFVNILTLIANIIFILFLLRQISLRFTWDQEKSLEVLKYSLSNWVLTIGSALFQQGDRLIVGALLGGKILGIYATLTSIAVQINILSATILQPVLPEISAVNIIKNKYKKSKNLVSAFYVNTFIALGLGQLLLILAPVIIKVFLPEDLDLNEIFFYRLMLLVYSIYSLNAIGYYILLGLRLTKISLLVQLGSGSLTLLLIYFLSIHMGLPGALIGNIGYLGVCLINYTAIKEIGMGTKIFLKPTINIILLFIIFSVLGLFITTSSFYLTLLSLIYIFLLIENLLFFKKTTSINLGS
jgi:O-antigen/teichoic acid export membrane protein